MKEIHNRTIYDTDKAELVYDATSEAAATGTFRRLYHTEKDNWFFHICIKDGLGLLEQIYPVLMDEEVIDYLEQQGQHELLLKYFEDQLHEA